MIQMLEIALHMRNGVSPESLQQSLRAHPLMLFVLKLSGRGPFGSETGHKPSVVMTGPSCRSPHVNWSGTVGGLHKGCCSSFRRMMPFEMSCRAWQSHSSMCCLLDKATSSCIKPHCSRETACRCKRMLRGGPRGGERARPGGGGGGGS